jgi:hypothetical protein
MNHSNIVFMLARQRSGTNPLREVLGSHPQIFCTPEVFHELPSPDAELEVETNFFNFLAEHPRGRDRRPLSFAAQEEIFLDFLSYLRCFSDKSFMFVDVKYNSTHHLDEPWREITARPTLFRLIIQHRIRVLNLTRRNYLRFFLSQLKANLTGRWTETDGGPALAHDPKVTLDIKEMMFILELCRSENDRIERTFDDYGDLYLTLDYEDLVTETGTAISAEALRRIARWIGVDDRFDAVAPQYRKQSALPLRQTIRNYAAVRRALEETGFEYCLEDERMYRDAPRTPRAI